MKLTRPKYADGYKKVSQMKFYGYDRLGTEGAICDMENMSSDYWPELAVRQRRYRTGGVMSPGGLFSHEGLLGYADGRSLYYGGRQVGGSDFLTEGMKTFVNFGDYVVIFPDKKYLDTVTGETGGLEASAVFPGGEGSGISFGSMGGEMSDRGNAMVAGALGKSLTDGRFRVGDAVTISGCTKHPKNNQTAIIREIQGNVLLFLDDTWELDTEYTYTVGAAGLGPGEWSPNRAIRDLYRFFILEEALTEGDVLVIDEENLNVVVKRTDGTERTLSLEAGRFGTELEFTETESAYSEPGAVTVSRTVPDMDFLIEHGGRLMGCKDDTIYISAAGDMFNWNVFDGTAADSYATETGSPGKFTGAASYLGYARFFKEDYIYTLYGDYPAEYSLQRYEAHGVMEGSERSLAVANGRLFYLSRFGPMLYTGSTPSRIGDAFGTDRYINGVGGSDGMKYYLSVESEDGAANHLFVYDTNTGLWMREDELRVLWFTRAVDLYYMDWSGGIGILGRAMEPPTDAEEEEPVEWFAEFGDFTESSPDKKLVDKLQLRLELEDGATAVVRMLFESGDTWITVGSVGAGKKRSVVLPIIPRRLDHFRLRIEGNGMARIQSITRQFAAAGER